MGKNVFIFTVEQAKKKIPEAAASGKKYYLIAKSISFLSELKKAGVDFGDEVIIGNVSNRPDTKKMYNNIYFNEQEIKDANYLKAQQMKLTFQLTPNDAGADF